MSVPAGYGRSFVPMDELTSPLTEDAARALLGRGLDASLHGTQIAAGTITDVREANGNLMVILEENGRYCVLCQHVYPMHQTDQLVAAGEFHADFTIPYATWVATYKDLRPWAPVCQDWASCEKTARAAG